MCAPFLAPIAAMATQAASAVGAGIGAAASGLTVGGALSGIGTLASVGGTLAQGAAEAGAARQNARFAERQARTERMLAGVEDERLRERMRGALAQQRSELAARGVSLDSPTAVLLGRNAAAEMSFASQSVRSGSAARSHELSAEARSYRARASSALLTGRLSAAAGILTRAPEIWPGLSERRVLS